jgi:tetraacyldisaccharide 4'-kinase
MNALRAGGEALYRIGLALGRGVGRSPRRVPAAVLSVGNLEVGGAGKTPCTLWWASAFAEHSVPVAVVCRPWGPAAGAHASDEVALYRERLPAVVRLYAGPKKAVEAEHAARHGAAVVIVDDGFSHRALARDLDLLLLDARRPFGNGRCLPAGPLREPPEAVARAGLVVLTRADRATAEERARARELVYATGYAGPVLAARHRPVAIEEDRRRLPFAGQRVYCVSGIARPGELAAAAANAGLEVAGARDFPDHHAFRDEEWHAVEVAAERLAARLLITAKDAVRLSPERRARAWVLEMAWEWMDGLEEVEAWRNRLAARTYAPSTPTS